MSALNIIQFSYIGGKPAGLTCVDCRVIKNPWRRGVLATDEERRERVRQDPLFEPLVCTAITLLHARGTIGIGCTFGRHRSVAVALEVANRTSATVQWHSYIESGAGGP